MALTNILRDLRGHIEGLLSHGATAAKTASTTMARDAAGRSKVAEPSATDDIATKGYADGIVATERTARVNAINALGGSSSSLSAELASERSARIAGDNGLQTQINALAGGSGRSGTFSASNSGNNFVIPGATNGKVAWFLWTKRTYGQGDEGVSTSLTMTMDSTATVPMGPVSGGGGEYNEFNGLYVVLG